MKERISPAIKAHLLRGGFYVILILTGTMLVFLRPEAPAKVSHRALTFAERIAYQRAIEDVYWRHRIWPKQRPDPKPSLEAVVSQTQLEKKVADYLRNSEALADYWQRPITAEELQAEMDRMANHTRQPEVLQELFDALGNDPFVIAECLARPALAERLLTSAYSYDQRFHGELQQRAKAELDAYPTVGQMKQLSGTYSEIELVRSDNADEDNNCCVEGGLRLNSRDWNATVQKLAAIFSDRTIETAQSLVKAASKTQITAGTVSSLQEDENRYYVTAVINKTEDRLRLATVTWPKEPLASWRARMGKEIVTPIAAATGRYTLPKIPNGPNGCVDDTWSACSLNTPIARQGHTAVWTGSEMIIWGGYGEISLNDGGRYDPSTDAWTTISTLNAPSARAFHTAVWTGTEMIVWGGGYYTGLDITPVNTGGRYNPNTDSWTATTTVSCPTARAVHTAVWTGNEMIIWGGAFGDFAGYLNTGARYNPSTNTWTPTSTVNAPSARYFHTAVWAGDQMIVWGGFDFYNFVSFDTGGRYNPNTNTWAATTTANAPLGRSLHTAVWTGSQMIVWGGSHQALHDDEPYLDSGGRYDPGTDSWTATSNGPAGRNGHTAVWTGSEMIIWGGRSMAALAGARYNPATDNWTPVSSTGAPDNRYFHTAVWTGTEMIVWGGYDSISYVSTGGRYNPAMDSWVFDNRPKDRWLHTAVWTGSEMIIWGGVDDTPYLPLDTGGTYTASIDHWSPTTTSNAPSGRIYHTAVWSGTDMIIWGGYDDVYYLNTGGRYNPATDTWISTSTVNAPSARSYHTAIWTGSQMIVWGGANEGIASNTGSRYDPASDAWTPTNLVNAPIARSRHTAVWTGNEMIVWGGIADGGAYPNIGGSYSPATNEWTTTSAFSAPIGRYVHTAVWTGTEMIIWGGYFSDINGAHYLNTGGRYNPTTNSWTATGTTNTPTARSAHTAVWTGTEMIVWGGESENFPYFLNTGGRYDPGTNSWRPTSTTNEPLGRHSHTAVWTGSEMIIWGGQSRFGRVDSGGRYCAESGPTPTPSPTPTPCTGRCSPTPRPCSTPHVRPTPR